MRTLFQGVPIKKVVERKQGIWALHPQSRPGEDRHTFHELRNTFVEAMEAAEISESTTKLIIGHARASMTYGRYSKGQRVQLRDAINKLRYSAEVMRLIRKQTKESHTPTRTKKKRSESTRKNKRNR